MFQKILGWGLLALPLFAMNAEFDPVPYQHRKLQAIRIDHPLAIDGHLEEDLYASTPTSNFVQFQPHNGSPASQRTQIWIAYDEHALYVGARMWDTDPDSIVTRVGRRDDQLNTDLFEVILDSYHDHRTGFSFQINPSGSIRDASYFNDGWTDESWDGIWDGRCSIDAEGWNAEMRIPFSQLRFSGQEEYVWGILPTRYIQRRDEWDYFVYIPKGESGIISRCADLTGIRGIHPPARQSILPYASGTYGQLPTQQDNPFYDGRDQRLGLGADMQFGIGGSLTVDATLNPDFGQVEVDPSQINLSAYETYYQEKRPFFVEGRNIFRFGSDGPSNNMSINASSPQFFYSRRIGRAPQGSIPAPGDSLLAPDATRILGAAKLSGKLAGGWSIGGLSALTNREYAHYYENGQEKRIQIEPNTSYSLLRARRDIHDGRQGVGVLVTGVERYFDGIDWLGDQDTEHDLRDQLNRDAQALGVDAWSFLGAEEEWALGAAFGYSSVSGSPERILDLQQSSRHYYQRPDAGHVEVDSSRTRLSGHMGRIRLNREKGAFLANFALGWVSPGFETNDMGLTWSADKINKHVVLGYRLLEPYSVLLAGRMDVAYANNHDFSGALMDQVLLGMGYAQFTNYWAANWFFAYNPESLSNTLLRGGPKVLTPAAFSYNLGVNSDGRSNLSYGLNFDHGFSADGSHNMGGGLFLDLRLGKRFVLETGPSYSRSIDRTQYVTSVEDPDHPVMYGRRYVVARLQQDVLSADIRVNYTLSPQLTIQGYFQPFLAVGSYSEFKEYRRPRTRDFLRYGSEGSTIRVNEDGWYEVNPGNDSTINSFTFYDPDFNYKALVGTLVLRWEFNPGSTLYLVWTHNGSNDEHPGDFQPLRDFRDLLQSSSDDVFALKVTYWLGR